MVRLKCLESPVCHKTCVRMRFCTDCGRITCPYCRNCRNSPLCPVTTKSCKLVYFYIPPLLDYLLNAPEDELKLLNFDIWCPFYCNKCKRTISTKKILGLHEGGFTYCVNCAPSDKLLKVKDNHPIVRIIDELKGYFGYQNEGHFRKGIQLESWKCGKCKANGTEKELFMTPTDMLCWDCKADSYHTYLPGFKGLLPTISQKEDLKLLTYSKWTSLACPACLVIFSENAEQFPNMHTKCHRVFCQECSLAADCCEPSQKFPVVALIDVIKEFRALFKNGGLDLEQEANKEGTLENDGQCCSTIGQETSQQELGENTRQDATTSTKGERNLQQQVGCTSSKETEAEKTSVARLEECASNGSYNLRSSTKEIERTEGIPTTIRCIDCSGSEDISRAQNCHTCEKYGICLYCVTKKHWGHMILDTEKEMLRGSFQSKSDETLSKLTTWKEDVDNIQRQAQTKLCESYRQLFEMAVQCGDPDLLQSINREGNVNQLHRSVKDYITYGIRLKSSVQNLDDKLALLLKEAKERNGAMLQGEEQESEGQ